MVKMLPQENYVFGVLVFRSMNNYCFQVDGIYLSLLQIFDFFNNSIILVFDLPYGTRKMRGTPGEKKYIDLNPTLAVEYLTFKKEYEGEDFLYIWNDIIEK